MDNLRSCRFFPVMWRGWLRTWWRCINEFASISKLARLQGPPAHQEGSVNCLRMKMMKMMKIIISLHTILVGQSNQKTKHVSTTTFQAQKKKEKRKKKAKKQHTLYKNEILGTQAVKMNPVKRHPRLINREIETLWNNNTSTKKYIGTLYTRMNSWSPGSEKEFGQKVSSPWHQVSRASKCRDNT